jgi:hypothetical protein
MRKLILLFLLAVAHGQILIGNGTTPGGGVLINTTPGGSPGGGGPGNNTPVDTALVNWNTSVAATPSAGPNICVGVLVGIPAGGCGTTYNTGNPTADLRSALANLACDQIVIMQNTIYPGDAGKNFIIPDVACTTGHWWQITRDSTDTTFAPENSRVDPCFIGLTPQTLWFYPYPGWDTSGTCGRHMPQLIGHAVNGAAVLSIKVPTTGTNTASIGQARLVGLELTRDNSADIFTALIAFDFQPNALGQDCALTGSGAAALPTNAVACMNDAPQFIVIDRCILHGDAQRQTTRAIALGGTRWVAVKDSYIYDIQLSYGGGGGDAQPILGGAGHGYTNVGEWLFSNNFSASSTQSACLFCGAFVEPLSPASGHDGVPESAIFQYNLWYKNPLWDSRIGQTRQNYFNIENQSYGKSGDQELIVSPSAIQLQTGQTIQLNSTWLNDSGGGINRLAASLTTVTVDTIVNGNTTVGQIVRNPEHNAGSGPWVSTNQITYTYTAPATAGTHTVTLKAVTQENRQTCSTCSPAITQGNSRTLTATVAITVVTGTPVLQIALTPSAPDLQIQPSYSDANGNTRTQCFTFFSTPNFSSVSMAWKVDGVLNGNSTVGQICSVGGVGCSPPASNDQEVAYCSGTAGVTSLGNHTISATSAGGTIGSQVINVSNSAPILAYDLKPFTSKNIFELKCGRRFLIKSNLGEVAWGSNGNSGGQNGAAALFQPANNGNQTNDGQGNNVGYAPEIISDILFDHNQFSHIGGGIVTAGLNVALGVHKVTIQHVAIDDFSKTDWLHGWLSNLASVLQHSGTGCQTAPCKVLSWTSAATPLIDNITLNHVTAVGEVSNLISIANNEGIPLGTNAQFQLGPLNLTNSILVSTGNSTFANFNGDPNDCNTASGTGANNSEARAFMGTGYTPALPCTSSYQFNHLALLDSTASPSVFTSANIWQPASTDATLFRNYNGGNGGDYRVVAGGQYDAGGGRQASDGTALGADIAGINTEIAKVRYGTPNPPASAAGTTVDLLTTYALMGTPSRLSNHLHGTASGGSDTYSVLDTDAGYPVGYPSGVFFWEKHPTGNPWDIEKYDASSAARHWITEDGDSVDAATCVANGFSSCFLDPNAYKRFLTPVQMLPRNFTYGSTVTIDTPGPNTFVRTTNCELPGTVTNINLGDVRSVTSGPFNMTWGGTLDSGPGVTPTSGPEIDNVNGIPTLENDYYYGGTLSSGNFNDKESTFYVQGQGQGCVVLLSESRWSLRPTAVHD